MMSCFCVSFPIFAKYLQSTLVSGAVNCFRKINYTLCILKYNNNTSYLHTEIFMNRDDECHHIYFLSLQIKYFIDLKQYCYVEYCTDTM